MIQESCRLVETASYRATVASGDYWLHRVAAGETVRITDTHGNQAVDTLIFSASGSYERYSAFDTIREQGNVYLTAGSVLLSDEGNPMATIVADTCGRHDTLGGACAGESNTVRYALDKKTMHSCRDSWLLALAGEYHQLGLTKRDLTHNINFFMNVPVTAQGGLTFADGISDAGKYVEMSACMDILILISNCPQLNNPCNGYNPTPIEISLWPSNSDC